ncbi:Ferrichrysobactin receptor [Pseudomonas reidholzensis]|uniref:Metal-pseudopaline receptor CntO n=1 Tax=Pseudomonas reidholzensis TaxID=1785162 RepID=A0A383RVE6_9PSED|nr:TonB-dependent siderophore receptor [Pseudomonas reidholzensis]SYX91057.1 Ferrichrysobactin receptor [Pseudomonas reidholzensis]
MRFSPGWSSLACAVHGTALALSVLVSPASMAASTQHFAIPPGPLGQVLSRFAATAGINLAIDPALVQGRQSQGFEGDVSLATGFARLLSGSGLRAASQGAGVYVLEPLPRDDAAIEIDPIQVDATRQLQESGTGPVAGYVARRTTVGTKTDTPINEIPQSISVISRDEMDQRGVQDFNSAVAYTPGIRVLDYAGGQGAPDIFMRGFRAFNLFGIYQDGLRTGFNQYDTNFETFGLERVDVIKGPASVLYGQMAPGGLVNMTSKRPQETPIRHVEVQGGSFERRQFGLDIGDQLDSAGTLFGRVVVIQRDSGTQVDHSPDDRTYIAPSLTWKPDDANTLTLLSSYNKSKTGGSEQSYPAIGTVLKSPNGRIDSDINLGWKGSYYHVETTSIGALYEHLFDNGWKLQQNLRYMHSKVGFLSSGPDEVLNDDGRTQDVGLQYRPKSSDTFMLDNNIQGSFNTGTLQHTLIAGVDYSHYDAEEIRRNGDPDPDFEMLDLYNPVYGGGAIWYDPLQRDTRSKMQQVGVYVQDQIKLDRWALTIGGREDWVEGHEQGLYFGTEHVDTQQRDHKFTGRVGLAYLFDNGITPYASYSTSFQPNPDTDMAGVLFKPTEGKQYEVGLKYQPPGSNSSITVSAFDLTQKNVTTADPLNSGFSVQSGEVRSRGIEVEGKASLTPNLNVLASYAYTDAKITEDTRYEGNTPRAIPRHTAAGWLDYTLDTGVFAGVGAGIGLRYMGSSQNIQNTVKAAHYTLTDATLRYDLSNVGLTGTKISITGTNLFDKRYFEPGFYENSVLYGNRRNVIATLAFDW